MAPLMTEHGYLWQLSAMQNFITYGGFNFHLNEIYNKIGHNKILINIINKEQLLIHIYHHIYNECLLLSFFFFL